MPEVVGGQFRLRVLDPKQFVDGSFRTINVPKDNILSGVTFVMGKKKIDGVNSPLKLQSIRFNIDSEKTVNGKKVRVWNKNSIVNWIERNITDGRIREKLLEDIRNFNKPISKNNKKSKDQNDLLIFEQLNGSLFD